MSPKKKFTLDDLNDESSKLNPFNKNLTNVRNNIFNKINEGKEQTIGEVIERESDEIQKEINNSDLFAGILKNIKKPEDTLIDVSEITVAEEKNSVLQNSTLESSTLLNDMVEINALQNSTLQNNNVTQNSTLESSTLESSTLESSTVTQNSVLQNSTLTKNSTLESSTVTQNSVLQNSTLEIDIILYIVCEFDKIVCNYVKNKIIDSTDFFMLKMMFLDISNCDYMGIRKLAEYLNMSQRIVAERLKKLQMLEIIKRNDTISPHKQNNYLMPIIETIYKESEYLNTKYEFMKIYNTIYSYDMSNFDTSLYVSMLFNNNNINNKTNIQTEQVEKKEKMVIEFTKFNLLVSNLLFFEMKTGMIKKITTSHLHNIAIKYRDAKTLDVGKLSVSFDYLIEYFLKQTDIKSVGGFLLKGLSENWGENSTTDEEKESVSKYNKKIEILKNEEKIDELSKIELLELINFLNLKIDIKRTVSEIREETKNYYKKSRDEIIELLRKNNIIQEGDK